MEEKATLAGGCFWCTQAIFQRLKGVKSVTAGYAGGSLTHPAYQQVSEGKTGHAETIQIEFDPRIISFDKLLEIFWATHDPTTPNRQGPDVGPQYRSAIFYHSNQQKRISEKIKAEIEKSGIYHNKIVTQIIPFENFYPAENYHQNYYEINKNSNPYCSIVIAPKIQKLLHQFCSNVKEEYRYGQNQD